MSRVTTSRKPRRINHFHTLVFCQNRNSMKLLALFTLWKNMGGIPLKSETQAKPCERSLEGSAA
jgi:hypothetical protein